MIIRKLMPWLVLQVLLLELELLGLLGLLVRLQVRMRQQELLEPLP